MPLPCKTVTTSECATASNKATKARKPTSEAKSADKPPAKPRHRSPRSQLNDTSESKNRQARKPTSEVKSADKPAAKPRRRPPRSQLNGTSESKNRKARKPTSEAKSADKPTAKPRRRPRRSELNGTSKSKNRPTNSNGAINGEMLDPLQSPGAATRSPSRDSVHELSIGVNGNKTAPQKPANQSAEIASGLAGEPGTSKGQLVKKCRQLAKQEKPLSKRMAKARLIPPSRRSTRKPAEALAPRKDSALDDNADTGDKNVTWNSCVRPPRLMRVPQLKKEGSSYKCCIGGCPVAGDEPFTGIWLFALPANQALKSAWFESVPIDPEINRPLSPRLCFQHFKKEDFIMFKDRPIGLTEDAVPTDVVNEKFLY
ncbi:uncharacterized protein [Dermacentor andersoni]|uniref:uncharacterized protein n=1 Tax=Dermacentor andersoni TaxID=34620 RepID=UPI0024161F83|nr:serine/threonine-protein kinase PRP4 homolog [Dermacentor andersoni]